MLPKTSPKTILCYGDSNTYGLVPGSLNPATGYHERYPRKIRWSGKLQQLLGAGYWVIEEGLCARTTNIDYPEDTYDSNRNGLAYLESCLYSHAPVDTVILFLGINDLKAMFNRTPEAIAEGMGILVKKIQQFNLGESFSKPPKIMIIGYPPILEVEPYITVFAGATQKSRELPRYFQALAEQYGCFYIDAVSRLQFDPADGCHLDAENHVKLAEIVYESSLGSWG